MNHTNPAAKAATNPQGRRYLSIRPLIAAIQKDLKPDLPKPQFRGGHATNPLLGHCYHSAEALHHSIQKRGSPEECNGYRSCWGVDGNNSAPWWQQNERGDIPEPSSGPTHIERSEAAVCCRAASPVSERESIGAKPQTLFLPQLVAAYFGRAL